MKKINKVKKTVKTGTTAMKIGAGLATAGVAAASYYFYKSKGAGKHRKTAAKLATDIKRVILTESEHLGKASVRAKKGIAGKRSK